MNVVVGRHHRHQAVSEPRLNQRRAVCNRDRGATAIGFEQQVFVRDLAFNRGAEDLFQAGGHQDEDAFGCNQRWQPRDGIVEQTGPPIEAEQGLGTIIAGGRPKACTEAACYDQRRGAIAKRVGRRLQSPPSSLSLVSNRPRISFNAASSFASKRKTNAGCVLEARTSPHPWSKFTRTPSISITS